MKWRIALFRPGTPVPCAAAARSAACEMRSTSTAPAGPSPAWSRPPTAAARPWPRGWPVCDDVSETHGHSLSESSDDHHLRFPRPLRPGDRIGVTSPSAGASGAAAKRVEFSVEWLRGRGYDVVVGECIDGAGRTSAPAEVRAAELPGCWRSRHPLRRAAVGRGDGDRPGRPARLGRPRRGRADVAGRLLRPLDRPRADHDPPRLGDDPRRQPRGHAVRRPRRAAPLARPRRRSGPFVQRDSGLVTDWVRFETDPTATQWTHVGSRSWEVLGGGTPRRLRTVDRRLHRDDRQPRRHAVRRRPGVGRRARRADHRLRRGVRGERGERLPLPPRPPLAGWFDHAAAVLVGRTPAPDHPDLTQREAVVDALGRLDLPIVLGPRDRARPAAPAAGQRGAGPGRGRR